MPAIALAGLLWFAPAPQEPPELLPSPARSSAIVAVDPEQLAATRREVMRNIAAGSNVGASPPAPQGDERRRGLAIRNVADLVNPEANLGDSRHQTAIAHFAKAAVSGEFGSEAVCALAVSSPRADVSQRALIGAWRAWQVRPAMTERTRELVAGLVDHPDEPVAAAAANLLAMHLRAGFAFPLAGLVDRALAEWPADASDLLPAGGMAPAPGMAEYSWGGNRVSRLVLLALHSGDARLVDKVAQSLPANSPPDRVRQSAYFTLLGLAIAAPRVDAASARRIHGWYIAHVKAWDRQTKDLTTWHCGVLATLTRLHAQVPADLLPSYAPLREWPLLHDYVEQQLGGLQRPR